MDCGEIPSPLSAHTCSGEESTVDSQARLRVLRLLGCSQQEGVATCLLSVLLQPSCGPTLVDFSEITWHPHWGWLRGGSASAGLCYGQHRPPPPPAAPAAFTSHLCKKEKHTHRYSHNHNVFKKKIAFPLLPLSKLTWWQCLLFTFNSIQRTNPCPFIHIFLCLDYTQLISNMSRPPARGFCYQMNRKRYLPNTEQNRAWMGYVLGTQCLQEVWIRGLNHSWIQASVFWMLWWWFVCTKCFGFIYQFSRACGIMGKIVFYDL